MVLVFGFAVLCRDGDAEQSVTAASAQVLPIDAVGGSFGHLRCERHGGNFKGHRQIVLVNLRVKGRGKGASGGRQGEKGSVSAEFRLFFLLFLAAVDGDVVLVFRLPVLRCDSDAEQSIAAAGAQVFPIDAVGGSFGHLRCERHGGNFKGHRQIVLVNLRVKGRGKGASGGRQGEKGSISAEFRLFFLLFLLAVDGDVVLVLRLAILCCDSDAE